MEVNYYDLTKYWKVDIDAKREKAAKLVENYTGKKIKHTVEDLPLIQKVIDSGIINKNDIATLQSLGVLFGDAISKTFNVDWCMINDEYGESPTLKLHGKQMNINALTIISKRIEENREIDLEFIFNDLKKYFKTHEFAND